MPKFISLLVGLVIITMTSCDSEKETQTMSDESWKLGWRMIENSWNDHSELANAQFDSLLHSSKPISDRILISGLRIKSNLADDKAISKILESLPQSTLDKICDHSFIQKYDACKNSSKEEVADISLQSKIMEMYVNDQATRGNLMEDLITQFNIDTTKITKKGEIIVDDKNQKRLKEIFGDFGFSNEALNIIYAYIDSNPRPTIPFKDYIIQNGLDPDSFISPALLITDENNQALLKEIIQNFGFPTKELIGREAMHGVFLIIQHADADKVWQKSQLQNLKRASENGDLRKPDYAYLYDRIKVNEGMPQKYGSQFETVDRANGIAKLKETEDVENLNQRRKEMDMMPIETYKRLILSLQ